MSRINLNRTLFAAILFGAAAAGIAQESTTATQAGPREERLSREEIREYNLQREAAIRQFNDEHPLRTQIFQIRHIKAETIQNLARNELKKLTLMDRSGEFSIESLERGRRSGGFGSPLAEINESAVAIPETNSVLVTATEPTLLRIHELIQTVDTGRDAPAAMQAFRVEVTLLGSRPAGIKDDSTSRTRNVPVHTRVEGILQENLAAVGRRVNKGDVLLRLESPRARIQLDELQNRLSIARESLELRKQQLEAAKNRTEAGIENSYVQAELQLRVNEGVGDVSTVEARLKQAEIEVQNLELTAPVSGVIVKTSADLAINQTINPQYVATIAEPIPPGADQANGQALAVEKPFDLARVGLKPEDFKEFGKSDFRLIGRSIMSMAASAESEGKTVARMGDYELALSYAGSQESITLLRVLLISDGKTLLESPIILNESKPAILGITNLNDTLIVVSRKLADE